MTRPRMFHLGLKLVLFSALAMPGLAVAADATFCDGYAENAAHEAALAERFACAFHGTRWMKDVEAHRAWCRITTKATVQAEAAARSKDIRLCMCEWYAEKATAQAAMSVAHQCRSPARAGPPTAARITAGAFLLRPPWPPWKARSRRAKRFWPNAQAAPIASFRLRRQAPVALRL